MIKEINYLKKALKKALSENNCEDVLRLVSAGASILYRYNQYYIDEDFEQALLKIGNDISFDYNDSKNKKVNDGKNIIFYDGFGLDTRGLARQYIEAIVTSGFHIIYIVNEERIDKIPNIINIIKEDSCSKIVTYSKKDLFIEQAKFILSKITSFKPKLLFMYTLPYDAVGVFVANQCKNYCKRALIDLTDHAFWLGKYAADYYIEFRNYGAVIAYQNRGLPQKKIVKLPFYPFLREWESFKGFPFKHKEGEIVLFSGGALYKTFDGANNIYYKVIENCLYECENLIFWYAGSGDTSKLNELKCKFPARVFYTLERTDLVDILKRVDIYFNTYPHTGGLMMQYAASCGKAPITLVSSVSGGEELIDEDNLGIKFKTVEEVVSVIVRMTQNSWYRKFMNEKVKNAVISKQKFSSNLVKVINEEKTEFDIEFKEIDVNNIQAVYKKRFSKNDIYVGIPSDSISCVFKYNKVFGIKIIVFKLFYKIKNMFISFLRKSR